MISRTLNFNMRDEVILRLDSSPGTFNYVTLSCSSDLFLKAYLVCAQADGKYVSLDFFVENRAYDANFLVQGESISKALYIVFFNLENKRGSLEIKGISFSNKPMPRGPLFLKGNSLVAGFDFFENCGMNFLSCAKYDVSEAPTTDGERALAFIRREKAEKTLNLLNGFDRGRLLQQSYYGTNRPPYQNNCDIFGTLWRYNPVQEGDSYGNRSRLVDFRFDESGVYIKLRPLDWSKNNIPADAYMESYYSFCGDALMIQNTFTDFSLLNPPANVLAQETPAMYVISPLKNFVFASGKKFAVKKKLGFWGDIAYEAKQHFAVKDNWSAWLSDDGYGVGLYTPDVTDHLAGRYKMAEPADTAFDKLNSVNYTAGIRRFNFDSLSRVSYKIGLAAGSIEEIKECFDSLKAKNGKRV